MLFGARSCAGGRVRVQVALLPHDAAARDEALDALGDARRGDGEERLVLPLGEPQAHLGRNI